MHAPLTLDRYTGLSGTEVRSSDGKKIGGVSALICDREAREPEWIRVGTGLLGGHVVVPVEGATIDDDGIHVPFEKDVVRNEPAFDVEGGTLTAESEHALCVYFALTGHPNPRHLTRYDLMRGC